MRPEITGFHGVEVSHHKKSGAIIRLHNCDTVSEDGGEGGSPLSCRWPDGGPLLQEQEQKQKQTFRGDFSLSKIRSII